METEGCWQDGFGCMQRGKSPSNTKRVSAKLTIQNGWKEIYFGEVGLVQISGLRLEGVSSAASQFILNGQREAGCFKWGCEHGCVVRSFTRHQSQILNDFMQEWKLGQKMEKPLCYEDAINL